MLRYLRKQRSSTTTSWSTHTAKVQAVVSGKWGPDHPSQAESLLFSPLGRGRRAGQAVQLKHGSYLGYRVPVGRRFFLPSHRSSSSRVARGATTGGGFFPHPPRPHPLPPAGPLPAHSTTLMRWLGGRHHQWSISSRTIDMLPSPPRLHSIIRPSHRDICTAIALLRLSTCCHPACPAVPYLHLHFHLNTK